MSDAQPQLFPEPHWRDLPLPADFPRRERLIGQSIKTLGQLCDKIYVEDMNLRDFTTGEQCEIETTLDQCRAAWERRQEQAKAKARQTP